MKKGVIRLKKKCVPRCSSAKYVLLASWVIRCTDVLMHLHTVVRNYIARIVVDYLSAI